MTSRTADIYIYKYTFKSYILYKKGVCKMVYQDIGEPVYICGYS